MVHEIWPEGTVIQQGKQAIFIFLTVRYIFYELYYYELK